LQDRAQEKTQEKALAEQVAEYMAHEDKVLQALDIRLEVIDIGYAKMSLTITEQMLNGFGIVHGGITFTLADTVFAFACNSRNHLSLAASCKIKFIKMARLGDTLTATASERSNNGRTGIYDVVIVNQNNEDIASFEGISHSAKKRVCETLPQGTVAEESPTI
jgi:acyl-CoA thioesterase